MEKREAGQDKDKSGEGAGEGGGSEVNLNWRAAPFRQHLKLPRSPHATQRPLPCSLRFRPREGVNSQRPASPPASRVRVASGVG